MHSIVVQREADFCFMWYPEFIYCFSVFPLVVKEEISKSNGNFLSICKCDSRLVCCYRLVSIYMFVQFELQKGGEWEAISDVFPQKTYLLLSFCSQSSHDGLAVFVIAPLKRRFS